MIHHDFYCEKCDEVHADVPVQRNWSRVKCATCGNYMQKLFNKMNFKAKFKDSHNSEYNKIGRKK